MMNTTRKSVYNILSGVLGQICTIAIGFILPRMFIMSYGSEVNGFLSSINQMFSYLTLLEAGVGAATVQALYAPIAKEEHEKISGILAATNRFYNRTGIFYLLGVLLFAMGYPLIVRSAIPVWTQILVILIFGMSGVVSYFCQAKYKLLLQAEGKSYIISNVATIAHLVANATKIILIYAGYSIVWIQLGLLICSLGQTAYYLTYIKRHYQWLRIKSVPDTEAISQRKSVLLHEIAQMVFNHTDVLLLTIILQDLRIVSVYALYCTFVDMISTLIGNVNTGFVYRLGQLYNTDFSRYYRFFDCYETYYMAFSSALYSVTYMFLLPFMVLYTEGVTDTDYLLPLLPFFFVTYKMVVTSRAACSAALSYAGHFRQTQHHAIIEAGLNLFVSIVGIVLCQRWWDAGIYGVLFGTIVAVLYRGNVMILYANKNLLCRSPMKTYSKCLINVGIMFLCCFAFEQISFILDSYTHLIVCAGVTCVIVCVLFFIVNCIANPTSFQMVVAFCRRKK